MNPTNKKQLPQDILKQIRIISSQHNIPEVWLMEDISTLANDPVSQWLLLQKFSDALKVDFPYAYLSGKIQFLDLTLKIKPEIFIPRPETEQLTEIAIEKIKNLGLKPTVADFCAGSGAIGLAIKKYIPASEVWLVENNPVACELIKENSQILNVDINLICGDCFEESTAKILKNRINIVVSNPPYIKPCELSKMDRSVILYEPRDAWLAPPYDPLFFYREIVSTYGDPNKVLVIFESSPYIYRDVIDILKHAGYEKVYTLKDLAGKERFIIGEPSSVD